LQASSTNVVDYLARDFSTKLNATSSRAPCCLQASNTKVVDFLARDFEQEASRRAAAKNAFALLGQHKWVQQPLSCCPAAVACG